MSIENSRIYILIIFFLFHLHSLTGLAKLPEASYAGSLNGYVKDEKTGETLVGASVFIKNSRLGAYTNKSGFYSIVNLPEGKTVVVVSFIGYQDMYDTLNIRNGISVRKDYELLSASVLSEEITVSAMKENETKQISVSKVNVPVAQLKQIRIGGEADLFRSLQFLPGILTSSQISSGLFIRGGSPDQNLVLIDGATVYNPSHLFGFISTFNSEAIKDVELIKGGFPAEFGGRLSAVLNLTQKDGNSKEVMGNAVLGALSSRLSLEGPLGNGSWFIGGRRTYLELIKTFISDDPESPLPDFHFYDINAKIYQNITDKDKIFISGFASSDELDYSSFGLGLGLSLGNLSGSARWTRIISDNIFSSIILSASKYYNNFVGDQSGFNFKIDNSINDYTLRGGIEWYTTEDLTTKVGFDITNYNFIYIYNFSGEDSTTTYNEGAQTNMDLVDWNYSVYLQTNLNLLDMFSIQTGLRYNFWDLSHIQTLDPRIAFRYQLFEDVALKAAWGIYHQNLRLASQPDFSFFDTWMPTDTTLQPSKATHYIFSIETIPWDGYNLNCDLYYKKMDNISEINTTTLTPKVGSDIFLIGETESWGVEFFLQKKFGKLTGWFGYALGFIESKFAGINGGKPFRPKYDRRHDLKVVAQYQLTNDWEVGASFTFQSGQSYTGATSRFESRLPGKTIGRGIIVPSQRFGLRLPPSHQLNVNASYRFDMWGLNSKVILDIYNVYNRRDIWFRYYNTRSDITVLEDVKLLPIIPSISLEVNF